MASYRVVFKRNDGLVSQDQPFTALLTTPVASLIPWREPQNYHGQRHLTGMAYLACMADHVPYESRLEAFGVLRLDHDPSTVRVVAQPFLLTWEEDARVVGHVPDFLVERRRQPRLLIDVKPQAYVNRPHNAAAFQATQAACTALGWEYAVWTEPSPAYLYNLRWLSAYHRTPHEHATYAPALLTLLRERPRTLGDLAGTLEPECLVRPCLFHLLWRREVTTDLEFPLDDHVILRAV